MLYCGAMMGFIVVHTTGMLHWMAINSSKGIGQDGEVVEWSYMLGSVLIIMSLMMVTIGSNLYR